MASKSHAERLFARAVKLYRQGELSAAAALFRKVAATKGRLATQARRYLTRIAAKRASSSRTARKPRTAARGGKAKRTKRRTTTKPRRGAGGGGGARRSARSQSGPKQGGKPATKPKPGAATRPSTGGKKNKAGKRTGARRPVRQSPAAVVIDTFAGPPFRLPDLLSGGGFESLRLPQRPSARRSTRKDLIKELATTAAPAPSTESEIVRRTPHIDIRPEAPLTPGSEFDAQVFVDQKVARAGEVAADIEVRAGTTVQVHLVASEHFRIMGATVRPMTVEATPRSDAPPFRLEVKAMAEQPATGSPHISALFMHDGRPCGMVRRAVEIAGLAAPPLPPSPARFEVLPVKDADLHVTIVADEERDGRKFTCLVQTPHLEAYRRPAAETWVLPDVTGNLVRSYMNLFTAKNASPAARIASLRGAGGQLFEAAPKNFRKIFWELVDAKVPFKDIAIVSEEPFIPWELMIPSRPKAEGGRERRKPLGLEFRIGRWTTPDMCKPRQKLTLLNSYVIAPDYVEARKRLQHAKVEADFVAGAFQGQLIAPARFADIERVLKAGTRTLVHFICHGLDPQGGIQVVELDNGEQLTTASLEGMDGLEEAFQASKPIVFLNACEIGRSAPALVGLGGFAASFIKLGASAVIAALWSVKDSIAHQIAMEFYNRVKNEPETPFAEILRKIRERAYDSADGEDTYAAYCFYGDPAAIASRA